MNFVRKSTQEGLRIAAENRAERVGKLRTENAEIFTAAKDIGLAARAMTLEIGCGKGHYLSGYAGAFPEELCVGIDLISSRVKDGARKAKNLGVANAFFVKAEAGEYLESLPEGVFLEKIFIMFSDPWPKKRHFKRRLIQDEFLSALARHSSCGAVLHFRTDHAEYFEWTLEKFAQNADWRLEDDDSLPFEAVSQFQRLLPNFQTLKAKKH